MKQQFSPKRILIVVKPENHAAADQARHMATWLTGRGLSVEVAPAGGNPDVLRRTCPDLVVVLGGDGTMLGVARAFVDAPVPLLGLNFGKVGFLAELHVNNWEQGLNLVLSGNCRILKRTAIQWVVRRCGEQVRQGIAVNDAVISRGALSRVISLDISAEGQHIGKVRADGLILSTPTGSSGYAVSAGGPLVHPELNAVTITPICPFLCNFPSMVLPGHMPVSVNVISESVETFLTADGQDSIPLTCGDVVEVVALAERVLYARTSSGTYFSRLRGRGFIEEHSGIIPQGS